MAGHSFPLFSHPHFVRYLKSAARFAGNFYWKTLGGALPALLWLLLAALCVCGAITFPLAPRALRYAYISYKPFGKSVAVIYGKNAFLGCLWACSLGALCAAPVLAAALAACAAGFGFFLLPQWVKVVRLILFPFSCALE